MSFISNLFKSNYRIELENQFKPLEELGFAKKYKNYGVEQNLTYISGETKVFLIWVTNDANPGISLTKEKVEIDLSNAKKLLLKDIPDGYTSSPRQNYWINNMVPRETYLNIFLEEILKQLKVNSN